MTDNRAVVVVPEDVMRTFPSKRCGKRVFRGWVEAGYSRICISVLMN